MLDFPVAPPIEVKDTPKARRVTTLKEARALVEDLLRERRFEPYRATLHRIDAVKTPDEAIEAIGALRELLAVEDLLVGLGSAD